MAEFVRVAGVSDVPPGEMMIVEVDGEDVVLANVGGEIYAIGGTCTHRGGPLGEGILMDDVVECPWHGGQFNVKTGEVVSAPPGEAIPTFQVQIDGDDIRVAQS